ncbi:MAG: MFS transporter [Gammaproteobacteria bacterium]|nr:MFS transporter [Gammaproteobacteria bacterium]
MTDHPQPRDALGILPFLNDGRLWRIFLFGALSGFPWLLVGSAMTLWLKDEGLSRTSIGVFGLLFSVWTFNFLWAPIIDHARLPFLHRLGQRRSWISLCLAVLVACSALLAVLGPHVSIAATVALCFVIALASATQDLAIDAYRITVIGEDEPELIGHGAAMATCGWWTGVSLPGAVAFQFSDAHGWPPIYLALAALLAVVSLLALRWFREPPRGGDAGPTRAAQLGAGNWFNRTYVSAVSEFFQRNGARLAFGLLAFIFLFKIGEAFLGRMVVVFYNEVGFSDAEIGTYAKALGLPVTIICALAAGLFSGRFGVVRGLLIAGIAMAATNLLFAWVAVVGPDVGALSVAVIADGVTSAFSTVAFVAFISYYTSRLHTATQYGALASLGNAGRNLVAAASGFLVDALDGDWAAFFVLTSVMVLPSLAILIWIARGAAGPQAGGEVTAGPGAPPSGNPPPPAHRSG